MQKYYYEEETMKRGLSLTDLVLGFVVIIAVIFFLSTREMRVENPGSKVPTKAGIVE